MAGRLTFLPRERGGAPGQSGNMLALGVLCTLLFLTFLDNTVVSVALGSIQTGLRAGVSNLQWVVGGYALPFASLMLACGMIGDELGRKKVMLSGAGVFCAGSMLCALAPSVGVLIAGRVIMGLGAAASEPGTLSMLRHLYADQRRRDRAVGIWAATSGLALAVGPVVGGALVGAWNWRGIFWFNLAFGLLVVAVASAALPESSDPDAHRVDTAGTLLGAGGLCALTFAIILGESSGFGSTRSVTLFAVALVAGVVFVWWERRAAHPLLDLRFLRSPAFTTANITAFCTYFATFAVFFFAALFLDEVVGYSGFHIALVFVPMTVLLMGSAVASGRLVPVLGIRSLVVVGCALFCLGLVLSAFSLRVSPNDAFLMIALGVTGLGIGTTVVPITSSVMEAVPPRRSGMAASSANTAREIGAVTGVAVLGALVNAELRSNLTIHLRHLGIPVNFQSIVIQAVETGGVPSQKNASGAGAGVNNLELVRKVIHAAYGAFHSGLHDALLLSAVLVFAAGVLGAVTLRSRVPPITDIESSPAAPDT